MVGGEERERENQPAEKWEVMILGREHCLMQEERGGGELGVLENVQKSSRARAYGGGGSNEMRRGLFRP